MAVTKRTRFEVLRRDNHTCRYCGAAAPDVKLTVDHVVPRTLGGSDDPSNLVTACVDCNTGKASIAPDQQVVDDVAVTAFLMREAVMEIAKIRRAEQLGLNHIIETFNQAWTRWTYGPDKKHVPRPRDWHAQIENFSQLTLSTEEMLWFVQVAMTAPTVRSEDTWRYFCGCCWNAIKERQETATRMVQERGANFPRSDWPEP